MFLSRPQHSGMRAENLLRPDYRLVCQEVVVRKMRPMTGEYGEFAARRKTHASDENSISIPSLIEQKWFEENKNVRACEDDAQIGFIWFRCGVSLVLRSRVVPFSRFRAAFHAAPEIACSSSDGVLRWFSRKLSTVCGTYISWKTSRGRIRLVRPSGGVVVVFARFLRCRRHRRRRLKCKKIK